MNNQFVPESCLAGCTLSPAKEIPGSSVDRAFAMFSHKFKCLIPNTALAASK